MEALQMKRLVLILGVALILATLTGCPTPFTPPADNQKVVPVFSLSALTNKSLASKSVVMTDGNIDQGSIGFCATMFQGFSTATVSGDTYQTDVIDEPYTFDVQDTASGTTFTSSTSDGTLSVTVDENTKQFSVTEDFLFDYNISGMGQGTIYREISTPTMSYDSMDSFHQVIDLKYYDWTSSDGGTTYSAKIDAVRAEIFKNAHILGILLKSEHLLDMTSTLCKDPRTMNSTELVTVQTTMEGLLQITEGKEWTTDEVPTPTCILIVYNLDTSTFDYKISNGSALFNGEVLGDLSTYTNGTDTLSTVLSGYGWTLLP